jgi:hypothetical protein
MAITLAGQSLPNPNRYTIESGYRGKGSTMADGSVSFDVVDSTVKRKFTLGFVLLTSTQKSALLTAWASLKTATGTLVDYDSTNYTVVRDPEAASLSFDAVPTAGGTRWAVTVNLIED